MKICIIAPTAIPIRNDIAYGGIEYVVSLASEELVKMGHDVILLASSDSKTNAKLIPTAKKASGLGIAVENEQEINKLAFKKAVSMKPDLIWDHTLSLHSQLITKNQTGFTYNPKVEIALSNHVKTGNIPVVHSLHGSIHDPFGKMVHGLIMPNHYFISISNDQYLSFKKMLGGALVGYVHNAVDTSFYTPGKVKKDYLVWVGRYTMEKGAHIALMAAHMAGYKIKLLGKLQEEHEYAYFAKFIRPLLNENDAIYSNIDVDEKRTLFREAFATLMPVIWHEPFGLVSIESMASGTPVIASHRGALPENLGNYGLTVKIDDLDINFKSTEITNSHRLLAERFAEKIKELNPETPQKLHKYADSSFSPKEMTIGYINLFEHILTNLVPEKKNRRYVKEK